MYVCIWVVYGSSPEFSVIYIQYISVGTYRLFMSCMTEKKSMQHSHICACTRAGIYVHTYAIHMQGLGFNCLSWNCLRISWLSYDGSRGLIQAETAHMQVLGFIFLSWNWLRMSWLGYDGSKGWIQAEAAHMQGLGFRILGFGVWCLGFRV